jgi:hypothetical protein
MRAPESAASAAGATNGPRYRGHSLAGALAFRRSVAALAEAFQGLAQSGPALHGRGQPIRAPGSQLLADRRRGRPGEFPNRPRAVCETTRRHRSPLHQPDRLALTPQMSELDLF